MSTNRRLFLKQIGLATIGAGFLTSQAQDLYAAPYAKFTLPRSTPEDQGISSSGILSFLDAVEKSKIEFHSIMVLRHGHVVAEGWWSPYAPALKHTLYSLSKSFTSTAVGLAISEGHFKLDTPVVSFFPKEVPTEISANLAAMTVQSLLTMSTGHAKDSMPALRTPGNEDWIKTFLALPVEHPPGTHFIYNTGATYMLSAIIQSKTGKTLAEYLKPRLFDPMGIEDYDWEMSPQGINTGGYGLRVTTEDIAKFGQLYLQNGNWNKVQLLPEAWVADASSFHIDNSVGRKAPKETDDWSQGYGYQFWRCTHRAFRGDGAFGQFCIMMPDQDAVVVITGESFNLQASIGLVWSDLLPTFKDQSSLGIDSPSNTKLKQRLKNLSISAPAINASSPTASRISAKNFTLEENDFKAKAVKFMFVGGTCLFSLTDEKGEHLVNCSMGKWMEEKNSKTQLLFPMVGRPEVSSPIAASATWTDLNTLTMTFRYTATAHSDNIICRFADDKLSIKFLSSVSKGNPDAAEKRAELRGKLG